MDPTLSTMIDQSARSGMARFSGWNAALFQDYCRAAILPFAESLNEPSTGSESGLAVATGFVKLICEGIGQGYLTTASGEPPENLMEYCLGRWLVRRLIATSRGQRLPLLVDSWNLLEGLLREPRWVNSYVMARTAELEAGSDLRSFLARVLKPLLEPAAASTWEGPYRVTLLSMRSGDEDFLPGDMELIAPSILSVVDRRRPVRWGVVLRKQGQSELAGQLGETRAYLEEPIPEPARCDGARLSVAEERISLPYLREPFRLLQVRAGFVVATAVDSQKLWIVESAT
jgi:hypothetical protein